MVSCPSCGKELTTTSSYCPWCSKPVRNISPVVDTSASQPLLPSTTGAVSFPTPRHPHSHRTYKLVIGLLLIVIAVLAGVALPGLLRQNNSTPLPVIPAPVRDRRTSQFWTGYKVQSSQGDVIDVKGNWTVPVVNCADNNGEFRAATVVAIGGGSTDTDPRAQVGMDLKCHAGMPEYSVAYWWCLCAGTSVSDVQAKPGDSISVEARWENNKFIILINDPSEGWNVYKENSTFTQTPFRSTAEWMVGEVSINKIPVPLTDFGQVNFTQCFATIRGSTGPMGAFSLVQDTMVNQSRVTLATPSYSGDGTSFSIKWSNSGP